MGRDLDHERGEQAVPHGAVTKESCSVAHTPGPWTVEHSVEVYGPRSRPIADCGEGEGTTAEMRANARLIAAAPDLLKALKQISDRIDRASGSPSFTSDEHDKLVALIAKATGA